MGQKLGNSHSPSPCLPGKRWLAYTPHSVLLLLSASSWETWKPSLLKLFLVKALKTVIWDKGTKVMEIVPCKKSPSCRAPLLLKRYDHRSQVFTQYCLATQPGFSSKLHLTAPNWLFPTFSCVLHSQWSAAITLTANLTSSVRKRSNKIKSALFFHDSIYHSTCTASIYLASLCLQWINCPGPYLPTPPLLHWIPSPVPCPSFLFMELSPLSLSCITEFSLLPDHCSHT